MSTTLTQSKETRREYNRRYYQRHKKRINAERAPAIAKWQRENRDKVNAALFKRRYGITQTERDEMLETQGFRCAVCAKEAERWHTDHCHRSGEVRGVLCHHCNLMLGNARDNPAILIAGSKYLKRFGNGKKEIRARPSN